MEITPDGARVLASILPVALLIIAIHVRGLRRRIRIVPKPFAKWATLAIIWATIVAIGICIGIANSGVSVGGGVAWYITVATGLLGLQTAATFYEFIAISMREEEEDPA